jgi:uncharacterized membrane protein
MKVMPTNRLEAFSDGVIAIIITIMVLELHVPPTADPAALKPLLPILLSYALSFIYLAIYWNNHHHLLHAAKQVNGRILWANTHLLFWLSLFPFVTAWVGQTGGKPWPTALYGFVFFMAALAYYLLQRLIVSLQGPNSELAAALANDWKGKLSPLCYLAAIGLAFVSTWLSNALYILVAALWVIPDRRIERLQPIQGNSVDK